MFLPRDNFLFIIIISSFCGNKREFTGCVNGQFKQNEWADDTRAPPHQAQATCKMDER